MPNTPQAFHQYRCTSCNQSVHVPASDRGITSIRRCTITMGCTGTMQLASIVTPACVVSPTPSFTAGMEPWAAIKHTQHVIIPTPTKEWVFDTMLQSPSISAALTRYDGVAVSTEDVGFVVKQLSPTQYHVAMTEACTGYLQLFSHSFVTPVTNDNSTEDVVSGGTWVAFAVPDGVTSCFLVADDVQYAYTFEDPTGTPWSSFKYVTIAGITYSVKVVHFSNGLLRFSNASTAIRILTTQSTCRVLGSLPPHNPFSFVVQYYHSLLPTDVMIVTPSAVKIASSLRVLCNPPIVPLVGNMQYEST